jgi:hypothetical protein
VKSTKEIIRTGTIILLLFISCTSKRESQKNEVDSFIAKMNDSTELKREKSSSELLPHRKHKEDEEHPWYDTPKIGSWIQVERLEQIKQSFQNDHKKSITDLVQQFIACDSLPVFLEIEGCAKNNVFYLKNKACGNKYLSVSKSDILSSDTFELENKDNGLTYSLFFETENDLAINGIKFIMTDFGYELDKFLKGNYEVFDAKNILLERIEYNSSLNTDSKIFASLTFNGIGFYTGPKSKPKIANTDLISVSLFTGKVIKDEEEDYRETIHYDFELVRTSSGFELHNGFDEVNNVFRTGLCYSFHRL